MMAAYTNSPWWADKGDEVTVIRGSDGDSICAMRRNSGDRLQEEQDANAALIAMAPEMFRSLHDLMRVMRKSDAEGAEGGCCSDEWDGALEDAEALIDLLTEEGVVIDDKAGGSDAA